MNRRQHVPAKIGDLLIYGPEDAMRLALVTRTASDGYVLAASDARNDNIWIAGPRFISNSDRFTVPVAAIIAAAGDATFSGFFAVRAFLRSFGVMDAKMRAIYAEDDRASQAGAA